MHVDSPYNNNISSNNNNNFTSITSARVWINVCDRPTKMGLFKVVLLRAGPWAWDLAMGLLGLGSWGLGPCVLDH